MRASTVMLTKEIGTFTFQVLSVATIKIDLSGENNIVLADSDDEICPTIDLFNTSHFPYRARTLTPLLFYVDVDKTYYSSFYMKLVCHRSPLQCPRLHLSSSSPGLNIIDALTLTKSRIRSKSNLTTIDLIVWMYVMSITCHHIFIVMFYLCCPQYLWVFLMHMAYSWMTRIRCVMDTLDVQQIQQILK